MSMMLQDCYFLANHRQLSSRVFLLIHVRRNFDLKNPENILGTAHRMDFDRTRNIAVSYFDNSLPVRGIGSAKGIVEDGKSYMVVKA
jgi:hypothetical protein